MGLIPPIARLVPEALRRFCEGLRYPHTFILLLPTFVAGLIFAVALIVQYMLAGTHWVEARMHLRPHRWLGW